MLKKFNLDELRSRLSFKLSASEDEPTAILTLIEKMSPYAHAEALAINDAIDGGDFFEICEALLKIFTFREGGLSLDEGVIDTKMDNEFISIALEAIQSSNSLFDARPIFEELHELQENDESIEDQVATLVAKIYQFRDKISFCPINSGKQAA